MTSAFLEAREILRRTPPAEQGRKFRDLMLELGHKERVQNLYRIKDKLTAGAVFFKMNESQRQYFLNRANRNIILKCRQVGYTTLSGIEGLDYALWEPNYACGIMAHLQKTVTTIFQDIVKFSYDWFVQDWGHWYNPTRAASNATELLFKDDGHGRPLNTSMRVAFDFRGKTLNFLHVSEASRVKPDRLKGSLQGVPETGEVILESTPAGRSGEFYRQWHNHKSMGSLAPYRGYFIPWWGHYPETREKWKLPQGETLTAYEREELVEKLGLSHAHIAWRRWCIEANCQGDVDTFDNEYPTDDESCFLTAGGAVFPKTILAELDRRTREAAFRGMLLMEGPVVKFSPFEKGVVFIWKKPEVGKTYVVGADPAGGVGQDGSAAYVKCRETNEYVAAIYGDIEPDDFGLDLYKLGCYYNKAWLCVEANNHGHAVLSVLKGHNYPHLYRRQVRDERQDKATDKLGWVTTNQSKLDITELLKSSCKRGTAIIYDRALVSEMSTFIQEGGRQGAAIIRKAIEGEKDDRVMAAALTEEMDRALGDIRADDGFEDDLPDSLHTDPITGFSF